MFVATDGYGWFGSDMHQVQIKYSFEKLATVLANTAVVRQYAKQVPIKGVGLQLTTVGGIQMGKCCRWSPSVKSQSGESLNCDIKDSDKAGTSAVLEFNSPISKPNGVIQFALGIATEKSKSGQLCPPSWTVVASIKPANLMTLLNSPKWGPVFIGGIGVGVLLICAFIQQRQKTAMIGALVQSNRAAANRDDR